MFVENPEFEGKASTKFKATQVDHPLMSDPRTFEEYKDRYANNWNLTRTDDGILTAKWHTEGRELQFNQGFRRSIGQIVEDIGQDPDNEVLILGGTGNAFMAGFRPIFDEEANFPWMSYEYGFYDAARMLQGLVNNVRIPTIGVINGSGSHTELAIMCDLTLMAEDAVIGDPHFVIGALPGDGIQIALRETMGIKRANYAMMMFEQIDAQKALDYGLVNEVLPRERLYDRAMEIAKYFMTKERLVRRLTSEILKQPWQKLLAEQMRPTHAMEMYSFLANPGFTHGRAQADIAEWRRMNERWRAEAEAAKPGDPANP